MNIPWFVSQGYLVFTPDIHYTVGEPGESAKNAIVSASNFLSKMSWVDAKRIGIQGHSFSGFETNFVIAHTHLFAAAAAQLMELVILIGELRVAEEREKQSTLF